MHSSVTLLTLASLLASNLSISPKLENDYRAARDQGVLSHKPVVVLIGTGSASWNQVTREGKFDASVQKLLSDEFVTVYVDADSSYGRQIADLFGVAGKKGVVISNRSGDLQAFKHSGELSAKELKFYLSRYADRTFVATTTENAEQKVAAPVQTTSYQPSPVFQPFQTIPGNCASCRPW